MIHQEQTGLIGPQTLHADAAAVKIGGLQIRGGEEFQQRAEENGGLKRLPVLFPRKRQDLLVGFVGDLDFHTLTSCGFFL